MALSFRQRRERSGRRWGKVDRRSYNSRSKGKQKRQILPPDWPNAAQYWLRALPSALGLSRGPGACEGSAKPQFQGWALGSHALCYYSDVQERFLCLVVSNTLNQQSLIAQYNNSQIPKYLFLYNLFLYNSKGSNLNLKDLLSLTYLIYKFIKLDYFLR